VEKMDKSNPKGLRLSDSDLEFVVKEAAPQFKDKAKLKQLIRGDESFRRGLVGDEAVFRRVMEDDETFLKISPSLYFEILLRKALKELEKATHTVERVGTQTVAVFDVRAVVDLLAEEKVLDYLASMLSSFTRIESYVIPIRVKKGAWRKIRFNDMDIDSLARFCEAVDEEHRFRFHKRIADVCLFILGMFPEYVQFDYRYPSSGEVRPRIIGRARRSMEDYEEEGKKFYKLAAEHESARSLELSEVFHRLYEDFNVAKKPLNFIGEHYLHYRKHRLFGVEIQ
jgi:hypothetical protein